MTQVETFKAMKARAASNRRPRAPSAAKPAYKPMKLCGKKFWTDVAKDHADKFSLSLDELAETFAHDEEWLVETHAEEEGNTRSVFRRLLFYMRLSMLFAREKRIALEKRVTELENRPMLHDAGIWRPANSYALGAGVSHQGSYWISQAEANTSRPGDGTDWRLAVKKGRDGKREPSQ